MTYEAHRLPQLWTMVEADDGSAAAYHLNTWERQITLLSEQSKRLKDLRADLVSRWPPEQSDASFAFVSRVTEMINAMDQTVDDSVRVRTGLKQVADALEGARKELAPLLAEYHDKGAAWRTMTHGAFPELPVRLISGVGFVPGADEYVLQAHQRKLDEQAREIMRKADQIVTEAQAPLSGYMASYARFDEAQPQSPGRLTGPVRGGNSTFSPPMTRALVPPPTFDPPVPPLADPGPVLAATNPTIVNNPNRAIPGVADGPVANVPSELKRRLPPGQSVRRSGGVLDGRSPTFEPTSTGRGPVQGVVGGFGGVAPIGRGREGTSTVRQTNRPSLPGRVIEGGGAPVAPGMAGGWRDRQYEEYVKRRQTPVAGDPDNPWTVAEGIAPVIEPPPKRRHDVGPGVIGIDR